MAKGSSFERKICKQLSVWWSKGTRDDIFWRTAGSGAMATTRGKKNKQTFGQYGDIQAVDPIGQPLIDYICFELKRGYNKAFISNILDAGEKAAKQEFQKFIEQAQKSRRAAKAQHWVIIHQRDRREATITMPYYLADELGLSRKKNSITYRPQRGGLWFQIKLNSFLKIVIPYEIKLRVPQVL